MIHDNESWRELMEEEFSKTVEDESYIVVEREDEDK